MNRNPRNYNGMVLPPSAQPQMTDEERLRLAVAQEVQAIAKGIYVRAASEFIDHGEWSSERFQALAKNCELAGRAYFEAQGLKFTDPPTDPASTPEA